MAPRVFTLLEIDLGGDIRRFITQGDQAVTLVSASGEEFSYETGAIVTSLPPRSVDIFGGGGPGSSASVTLFGTAPTDLWSTRDRAPLQTIMGRLYWWREGTTYEERREIHRGAIRNPSFEFWKAGLSRLSFSLEPPERRGDVVFPPDSIGDEGRFPFPADNAKSQPCPVIYGTIKGAPAYACLYLPFPVANTVLMVAGHEVVAQSVEVRRSDGTVVPGSPFAVTTDIDGLGSVYSRISIPRAEYDTDSNLNFTSVLGKPDPKNPASPIDGLGDVLLDMWHSYSREDFFDLDRSRVYAARPRLNRYKVGAIFNERSDSGTLFDAMASRFGDAFPVAFNYTGGRLGWDAAYLPGEEEVGDPAWNLVYQDDTFERSPVTETSIEEVHHAFLMHYGIDGFAQGETQSLILDETTLGLARRALTRYGEAPLVRSRAPDVQDPGAAYALLTDKARALTSIRTQVTYSGLPWDFNDYPLFSVGLITDEEVGWDGEPFLIVSIQPDVDGEVTVGFVSLRGL